MAEKDAPNPDLLALRVQIDALDRELLAALNRRARLAQTVGEVKKREGSVAFRPEREAQVIDGLKSVNSGPLKTESVAPIWREIMSACRALETPTRVAYLGPAGTFSEEAALGYFGSSIVRVPCASVDEVFRTTTAGAADFGVVPVENSTEGMVARSLDQFLVTPLFIIGETSLFVRHNLLRKTNSLEGISAVCAHPQALAQCHMWLNDHLPHAERRPVASNAEGARLASLDPTLAAVASTRAGSEYGLHVVSPAIQDDANNRTRFAIVTHPERHPAPKASGHDCTSLVVTVSNRPGALHDMLVPLKANGVSMTKFESRPARSGQWEYYFYIDIEGHPESGNVRHALEELRKACGFFKILGTYPVDVH
jgi:chorismate mutase/prephenate dehydratase